MSLRGANGSERRSNPLMRGDCFGPRKHAEQERPRNDINLRNQKGAPEILGRFVTTQQCRCKRTSAKQSPIKHVNLVNRFILPNRRLLRRGERAPRNDMIDKMAE